MRFYSLEVENIGPFDHAKIEFQAPDDPSPTITILTGQNGTGKTVLIDAIRVVFGELFAKPERSLFRSETPFGIAVEHSFRANQVVEKVREEFRKKYNEMNVEHSSILQVPVDVQNSKRPPNWIVDYWRSQLAAGSYRIQSLSAINHRALYNGSLQGILRNHDVTNLLCNFEWLRDSRIDRERRTGEALYALAEKIVRMSLLDGELVGIQRTTYTPIVRQAGHEVPLENISSGNAYLVQRMLSLLGKMYSLHVLRETEPETIAQAPGLLLIDEAENHLHPVLQKRFLPSIRELFPNLQLIVATHSPFIVASVSDARVYVCRYDSRTRKTTVSEETAHYQNKPIDEILASPAFDQTAPFGQEITDLLDRRKKAIAEKNEHERAIVEAQLTALNPTYFGYLDLEKKLEEMSGAK